MATGILGNTLGGGQLAACVRCGAGVQFGQMHVCGQYVPPRQTTGPATDAPGWFSDVPSEALHRAMQRMVKQQEDQAMSKVQQVWAIHSVALAEAAKRAKDSEIAFIRLQIEEDGVVVIAECGGRQGEIRVTWDRLGQSTKAELLDAIHTLEADME